MKTNTFWEVASGQKMNKDTTEQREERSDKRSDNPEKRGQKIEYSAYLSISFSTDAFPDVLFPKGCESARPPCGGEGVWNLALLSSGRR